MLLCPKFHPVTSLTIIKLTLNPLLDCSLARLLACLCAVVVGILGQWARRRAANDADDNVAQWGSWAIEMLAWGYRNRKACWLDAGAEGVLRGIAADTSDASSSAKSYGRDALKALGLQA